MIAQLNRPYITQRPWKAFTRILSSALFEGRAVLQRSRWLNILTFAQFAVFKRLPQLKRVKKPIYILGPGRSGSTILGLVLSFHKQVGFLNEPKALWHAFYPNEDVIGSYSDREPTYSMDESMATEEVKRHARRLYGAYLRLTWASRVVDKSSEPIFRIPFIQAVFPDAKHLFLVRNGWDVAFSIARWSNKNLRDEGTVQSWWGVNDRKWQLLVDQIVAKDAAFEGIMDEIRDLNDDRQRAVVEWTVTMRKGLSLMKEMPNSVLLVKFEDLCRTPHDVLEEIVSFCELASDSKFLNYGESVLSPVPARDHFEILPCLELLFGETMKTLGYQYSDSLVE